MRRNSGQVAVFVLLIMLLGLIVGLSVMSRTLIDLKSTSTSDQSSRAFTAAEAGVESALSTDLSSNPTGSLSVNGIPVNYKATLVTGSYASDGPIEKDDVIQIDLVGNNGHPVRVYWTKNNEDSGGCNLSDNGNAALEITIYNVNGNNYSFNKYAYDPQGCSANQANDANGFDVGAGGGNNYRSAVNINPTNDAKMMRIKPIYKRASIMVTGSGLPAQAYEVTSYATSSGQVTRAVQIYKSKGSLPPFFDYVLFGGTENIDQ